MIFLKIVVFEVTETNFSSECCFSINKRVRNIIKNRRESDELPLPSLATTFTSVCLIECACVCVRERVRESASQITKTD